MRNPKQATAWWGPRVQTCLGDTLGMVGFLEKVCIGAARPNSNLRKQKLSDMKICAKKLIAVTKPIAYFCEFQKYSPRLKRGVIFKKRPF